MMRLFVALPLPVDVRARLGALQSGLAGARWIDQSMMHMTLRFIGEVPERDADDIGDALASIEMPAFDLSLGTVGYFERRGVAHTLWAGIAKCEALTRLQAKIESAVVRCGQPRETRKFAPHITIARLRDVPVDRLGHWLEDLGPVSATPFTADRFVIYQSLRGHGGAQYQALADYPLIHYDYDKASYT
ncbi:MAG: RNA 2',3'-cyclic phosphodiesterase [Rhodospirillales bacterium]